jgi:hypothetical protein
MQRLRRSASPRASRLRRYELTNVAPVTNDAPCRAGVGENAGLADCRAVHVPNRNRATVVLQHDVSLAVVVHSGRDVHVADGCRFGGFLGAAVRSGRSQDDTKSTVRLAANLFVVMTSLVLGLMMNSAKNTLETDNRNVHAASAIDLIILDRTVRTLGPQACEARPSLWGQISRPLANSTQGWG